MRDLPGGTVTFLFTDIEGSTALLDQLGDGYAAALEEHRRGLREAFTSNAGVEVDTQGDAFFVAFSRASDAAAAALAGQRAVADSAVRVRMGLHTGEPLIRDEGYVGMDVHRAARVMNAGHGGQIVVSQRTRSLLDDELPFRDLGVHRLKDLREPERLYQLGAGDFPALRTLDATNLPGTAAQLIGRERELGELLALLSGGQRLITLTGAGGTGKTRLALEACAEYVGRVNDGVYWVPLAGIADPELVVSEIAQALGAREDLSGFLRGRELLVLLDNFEHLLEAAPALPELLAGSRGLRLLVTSRSPLRVSGEHEYVLEPLAPDDSVTLFCERTRAFGREVSADKTAEAICRRLDGLPLAIELAAARMKLLSPESLLERLGAALPLLTGGTRDAPARQQTLTATIEWSYDLLDDPARDLFARLSVFAGSFTVDAAEAICDATVDTLAALLDASLLKAIGNDRLLLLQTIREYATERIGADGDETERRRASFFAESAEAAYARRGEDEAGSAAELAADHDDLRKALDWFAKNDRAGELRLAGALGWFWLSHGHLREGGRRLEAALSETARGTRFSARALTAAGGVAGQTGRPEAANELLAAAIAEWEALGDDAELAASLEALGWALFFTGDNDASLGTFERSLELRSRLPGRAASALSGVCQVLVAQGNVERAEPLSQELLELSVSEGDVRSEHFGLHFLADCALMRREFETAETRYRASLRAARQLGDVVETSLEIQGVAMAAAGAGDLELATRLGGAVEALWESIGIVVDVAFWSALLDRYLRTARAELGAEGDRIWAEGRRLTLERAVELALAEADS
jgi:predicted ATPase/class 3 adenylate cyclase